MDKGAHTLPGHRAGQLIGLFVHFNRTGIFSFVYLINLFAVCLTDLNIEKKLLPGWFGSLMILLAFSYSARLKYPSCRVGYRLLCVQPNKPLFTTLIKQKYVSSDSSM